MFDRFGWAFDLTRVAALRWMLGRTMLVLIAALVGAVVVDHLVRREFAAHRRGLDALPHELSVRAINAYIWAPRKIAASPDLCESDV